MDIIIKVLTRRKFLLGFPVVFLFFLLVLQSEAAHNLRSLLSDWLKTTSIHEQNSDSKVNSFDFALDSSHSITPTVTPVLEWPELSFTKVAEGFTSPIHIASANDGTNRLFIVEQGGKIKILKNGVTNETPFLDISSKVSCCGERGLLSVVFPPNYQNKKYFYVDYTNTAGHTIIARYNTTSNPDIADQNSEQVILQINQPYANHNGGLLSFGPDGYLYIGTGDGGSSGDPQNRAQNQNELLGKILRIDVENGTAPYSIPPSNPFVGQSGKRSEIWAYGLRNPWRFSFDKLTGDLYIADVGQNNIEEVNVQQQTSSGGENYGWKIMEGTTCYNASSCTMAGLIQPVAEYTHSKGCSVTGGFVYRGTENPRMYGKYFYGDYCSGIIWGLRKNGSVWETQQLVDTSYSISTFSEDELGEMYLTNYFSGEVLKMSE